MSETGPEISPRKARIERLKKQMAEGNLILDPYEDPQTQEEIRQANLSQTETTQEDPDNPWEPLPVSMDQDPEISTEHLPRTYNGGRRNQPVVAQGSFDGPPRKRVMSTGSGTRQEKAPQPYERGRVGLNSAKDKKRANQQRFKIAEEMRSRGEDV